MTTDIQSDTDFYWTTSLQNLPILCFFGEVCRIFGLAESYDIDQESHIMRHKVWETRGLYYHYQVNREKKAHADVIIVCTREETRDIILEILFRMAEKRRNKS
ncbi:MAG: hypothetical protein KGD60_14880 [Candidatus Thorarchaeota archaeon]|nr:hypothetical protein [Candidatus Thorarchaeota archaeon]